MLYVLSFGDAAVEMEEVDKTKSKCHQNPPSGEYVLFGELRPLRLSAD